MGKSRASERALCTADAIETALGATADARHAHTARTTARARGREWSVVSQWRLESGGERGEPERPRSEDRTRTCRPTPDVADFFARHRGRASLRHDLT